MTHAISHIRYWKHLIPRVCFIGATQGQLGVIKEKILNLSHDCARYQYQYGASYIVVAYQTCHFRSYKGQLRYFTLLVSLIHPYPRLAYSRGGVVHCIWYKESQWIKRCQWWSTHWPFPLMNTLGTHGGCGAWQWSTLTTNVLICQSASWHGWFMYNTALNIGRTNTSFITLTHSRICFSESNVSHTMAFCGM